MRFALEEMKIVLISILQRYSLELLRPAAGEGVPSYLEVLFVFEEGLHVRLRPRHRQDAPLLHVPSALSPP
jgi:hypothetical protein